MATSYWRTLELRHRRRARDVDRIRSANDSGLMNLLLHDFANNQICCALVAFAVEITAWMHLSPVTDSPDGRTPKRLRLRLFSVSATLARSWQIWLHLAERSASAELLADAIHSLRTLAVGD